MEINRFPSACAVGFLSCCFFWISSQNFLNNFAPLTEITEITEIIRPD